MQYLLMIYDDERNWNNMTQTQQVNMIERYIALESHLKEKAFTWEESDWQTLTVRPQ